MFSFQGAFNHFKVARSNSNDIHDDGDDVGDYDDDDDDDDSQWLSIVVIPAIKRTLDEPLTFSRCRSKPVEHLIASIMCLANSAPFLVVAIFAAPLN